MAAKKAPRVEPVIDVAPHVAPYGNIQKEAIDTLTPAQQILESVKKFQIVDDASYREACEILKQVKVWEKELTEKKEGVTKPLNAALNVLRGWFKPTLDVLTTAEMDLKRNIASYAAKVAAQNEAAMQAMAEAARSKDMPGVSVAVSSIIAQPKVAGVSTRKVLKWRVLDAMQVPRDYLSIDPDKVEAAVKVSAGTATPIPEIPGIEFYEETLIAARG
jgi:hypothetical protein